MEMRLSEAAELRVLGSENERPGIQGYAAVYSTRSRMLGGQFVEQIAPGVFARALASNPDVRATVEHDPAKILGRTTSGTLQLEDTPHGLRATVARLPDTSVARDLAESVRRGDVSQMSFAFRKAKDSWREERGADGKSFAVRTLLDLEVVDVATVTDPAYLATEVNLRSATESMKAWVTTEKKRGRSIQKSILEILERMAR